MLNARNEDFTRFYKDIEDAEPVKIVLSQNASAEVPYKKMVFNRMNLSQGACYQAEMYTQTQVFHRNLDPDGLMEEIASLFGSSYRQINVFGKGLELEGKTNKKGSLHVTSRRTEVQRIQRPGHNREKRYLFPEGCDSPILYELGIFTEEGKIRTTMRDKYRQINRFTELVEDALKNYQGDRIRILDFGCGKSYLTFVVYEYLTGIRGIRPEIIGLDLKADVIDKCNALAERFGYRDLRFEVGDINGYRAPFEVDMVITLHACDTATDYALYNAIQWGAGVILSVPCCQHELNRQVRSDRFSGILKYGILKERMSAIVTDAIRGCALEACGYHVDLLEFIDIAHSPKNIMIRAVKKNVRNDKRRRSYEEAKNLMEEFRTGQKLMDLLEEKGFDFM